MWSGPQPFLGSNSVRAFNTKSKSKWISPKLTNSVKFKVSKLLKVLLLVYTFSKNFTNRLHVDSVSKLFASPNLMDDGLNYRKHIYSAFTSHQINYFFCKLGSCLLFLTISIKSSALSGFFFFHLLLNYVSCSCVHYERK